MRLAILSHIRHPIAAPFMGGMEAHSHALAAELTRRGHDMTLFASGDSVPPAGVRLEPIVPEHYDRTFPWHQFHGTDTLNHHLDTSFEAILPRLAAGKFDLVHNNSLHRYPPRWARTVGQPMLTSLHVPPFDALHRAVQASGAPWSHFTVCSNHQLDLWSDGARNAFTHVVPNGIDTNMWAYRADGDGSAVWFGRITPNKGTAEAVQAALRSGLKLRIYGPVEHEHYFNETVRPFLGSNIVYGGNLSPDHLAGAVAAASVALFTPCWDEPFGLAAIEAMSCGVPVAAFDRGAVCEVVPDSGGALAETNDVPGLVDAIGRALACSRRDTRAVVLEKFAIERMVDRYEELYMLCAANRSVPAPPVHFRTIELPRQVGLLHTTQGDGLTSISA